MLTGREYASECIQCNLNQGGLLNKKQAWASGAYWDPLSQTGHKFGVI